MAPGTIVVTTPGELNKTDGVKRVFHAAAVQGQRGVGYRPVPDVEACVSEALKMADSPNIGLEKPRSILFPLLGTGTGGAELKETFERLIRTAIDYLEQKPASAVSTVYFWRTRNYQRDACLHALSQAPVNALAEKRRAKARSEAQ